MCMDIYTHTHTTCVFIYIYIYMHMHLCAMAFLALIRTISWLCNVIRSMQIMKLDAFVLDSVHDTVIPGVSNRSLELTMNRLHVT